MRSLSQRSVLAGGLALVLLLGPTAHAEEIPKEYRETINKGLDWLAKNQFKDGHWEGVNGQYAVSMTALGGMAFLCEGSTIREGKYRDNIRRAVDWLMDRVQSNGLIGNPTNPTEGGRYMYGHGFGLLFLSCVVGEEENARRREKLVKLLEQAAKYSRDAQTNRGGWGYVSAKDGSNFDEGSRHHHAGAGAAGRAQRRHHRPQRRHQGLHQVPRGLAPTTRAASCTAWPSAAAAAATAGPP